MRAILRAVLLATVTHAGLLPDGYWTVRDTKDYEEYVRIKGDSGFLCVLDNKSSTAFEIIGDSITTPWGRLDGIDWYPSSGDLVISGIEKGEAYSTRYQTSDSTTYANKCAEVESEFSVTAVKPRQERRANSMRSLAPLQRNKRDVLGRETVGFKTPF